MASINEQINKNVLKDNFSMFISSTGIYTKILRVLSLYEPICKNNIAVDIRLLMDGNHQSLCGVRVTVEEFIEILTAIKKLGYKTERVAKKAYGENRGWQLYTHDKYNGIWLIDLKESAGNEYRIGLTLKEIKFLLSAKDIILAQIKKIEGIEPSLVELIEKYESDNVDQEIK